MVGKSQRECNDHQRRVGEARCGEGCCARDKQAGNVECLAIRVHYTLVPGTAHAGSS